MVGVGYNIQYVPGMALNNRSEVPWPEVAARALLRTGAELRKMWLEGMSSSERAEEPMSFVVEPLRMPSVVRPDHEKNVVYVRLAAPRPAEAGHADEHVVAVLPDVAAAIDAEVRAAMAAIGASPAGPNAVRGVLVGADSIVDPAAVEAPGYADALAALVAAIEAFAKAKVPFVWRTRGGIDGPIPHALGQALADAGALAVVELGVPTLDAQVCAALEGHAGTAPDHRLRLATALTSRNVTVRGLVDPLVPMLTDQQHHLDALAAAFADAGVQRLGARYIVLTKERAKAVASRLAGMQRALLQGVFADEPWHKPDADLGLREVHKRIPTHLRRAGHHRLIEAAAKHGLFVDILDPVEDELEELSESAGDEAVDPRVRSASSTAASAGMLVGNEGPKRKRARPQLELFRKAR